MAAYKVNAADEIREAVGETTARRLARAVEGRLRLSPGRLARLAEALSVMSDQAKELAKREVVLDQGRAIDAGVVFGWRKAYDRENLDTKAIRLLLPRKSNPHLYSDTPIDAAVTVSVGPPPAGG